MPWKREVNDSPEWPNRQNPHARLFNSWGLKRCSLNKAFLATMSSARLTSSLSRLGSSEKIEM
jgi:hypothetical protein